MCGNGKDAAPRRLGLPGKLYQRGREGLCGEVNPGKWGAAGILNLTFREKKAHTPVLVKLQGKRSRRPTNQVY